jgi:hypothetical protein
MRFHRLLAALGVAALNLAVFGILDVACQESDGGVPSLPGTVPPTVTLSPRKSMPDRINGPTGSTFFLQVGATSSTGPVEGLSIALGSQPTSVMVTPSTVTTDDAGQAQAYAFVPYDVKGVVVAAGGGSLPVPLTISNGTVTFQGDAGASVVLTPSGATFPVNITAMAPGGDTASPTVPGMAVNFTAQPSGVIVSPPMVVTNDGGEATAYAFVPYETQGVVVVSAAGAALKQIGVSNPAVTLQGTPVVLSGNTPSGTTFQVAVIALTSLGVDGGAPPGADGGDGGTLTVDGGTEITGFPVSFTAQPASILVSPATVTTADGGEAVAYVFVPYNTQGFVIASGTGAVPTTIPVANPALVLGGDAGLPTEFGPAGSTIPVYVAAESVTPDDGDGGDGGDGGMAVVGVAGVLVSLTAQAPAVLASSSTVTTGADGGAVAYVFLPYNAQSVVLASAGGSLVTAIPVGNSALVLGGDAGCPTVFGPAGVTIPVYVQAEDTEADGGAISGVSVGFTAQAPAVLASSPTVTTGANGEAMAYVFLPYNAQSVVLASAGGSLVTAIPVANSALVLGGDAGSPMDFGPTGATIPVYVTAATMTPDDCDGGDGGMAVGVAGVSVGVTAQPPAVLASSPTVATGADGGAVAYVFLPYNAQSVVLASAGGSVVTAIPVANSAVSIVNGSAAIPTVNGPTGSTFPVTVGAIIDGGAPNGGPAEVAGLPINFTAQAPAVLVSAATLPTGANGQATAYVFLPYASQGVIFASGGNSAVDGIPISNAPVSLDPGLVDAGDFTATGQLWFLSSFASANVSPVTGLSMPVPGLTLTFTPLPTGTPSTAVTNLNGSAMASIFAPWGPDVLVMIAGGGSTTWINIPTEADPITLSPLCWQDQVSSIPYGVYQVWTSVTDSNGTALPGVSVAFSVISTVGSTSTIIFQPPTALTNDAGIATSFVAAPDAGVPDFAVQATAGSSTMSAIIPYDAGLSDAGCGTPPQ